MKHKIVLIVLCIFFILGFLYLQWGMDITVNSITTESNPLGYSASVTITANKLIILNKRKYEDSLLQRVKDNELPNMKLSYDVMGEPNELTITVYANILMKLLCVPSFQKIEKRPSRPFFSLSKGMRVKYSLGKPRALLYEGG